MTTTLIIFAIAAMDFGLILILGPVISMFIENFTNSLTDIIMAVSTILCVISALGAMDIAIYMLATKAA